MSDALPLHRPVPRRPFDLAADTPSSPDFLDPSPRSPDTDTDTESAPKRSRSALSLAAGSTLFGIYGKTYTDEPSTPALLTRNNSAANLAAELQASLKPLTSLRSREEAEAATHHKRPQSGAEALPYLIFRVASLFVFGVAYGVIVTHLHDRSPLTAGWDGWGVDVNRWSTRYLVFWGLAGVGLGSVLPWLDGKDESEDKSEDSMQEDKKEEGKRDWNPAVRSIGAFVGIAYAIRRLPWQSTLQLSLALALVNPFLWFVVDRTRSGFWFASLVGIAGTAFLLQISPEMIRTPSTTPATAGSTELVGGIISVESIAIGTWISSVLFCSCVCFGNIGRKLAGKAE